MNLDQLRYICTVFETGSISRAADKLFLSQPNISSAISKLERELGFSILLRSHNGVQFTEKGLELVQYASRIVEECSVIQKLREQPLLQRFRVMSAQYPPVDNAFISLCAALEQEGELSQYDLRLTGGNWTESLPALNKKSIDLAVICVPEETINAVSFRFSLDQHHTEFYPLARTSVVVKLSQKHPLLQESPFPFEKLGDYPMTEYFSRTDTIGAYGGMKLPFQVKLGQISIDTGRTRTRLIAQTNAWGIAVKLPRQHEETYGICYVEVPGERWVIGYLRDPDRAVTALEEQFLGFLRNELAFLNE